MYEGRIDNLYSIFIVSFFDKWAPCSMPKTTLQHKVATRKSDMHKIDIEKVSIKSALEFWYLPANHDQYSLPSSFFILNIKATDSV